MKVIKLPIARREQDCGATSSWRLALEKYEEWQREMNYSVETIASRRHRLGRLQTWCQERDVIRLNQVTLAVLEGFQKHLFHYRSEKSGAGLAVRTQRDYLCSTRDFFRWCVKKKLLTRNPAAELDLPRVGRRLPRHVLTQSETEQVLNSVDLMLPAGVRDRAILETFYSTGIRRRELSGLKLQDLDMDRGTVMVRQGKGMKDRLIPIGSRAVSWIEKYLTEVRPVLVKEPDPGNVFLNREGRPINFRLLSKMASDQVKKSGISKSGSCHLFRHTMATLMLENGSDVRYVQEMLGHEHLSSTQIYTHVAIHKLKEVHTETHPGAELSRKEDAEGDGVTAPEADRELQVQAQSEEKKEHDDQ